MRYAEKLKDPRWQKKRLEILDRDCWHCGECGDANSTLHVHHGAYFSGVAPWDYPEDTLFTLCENCHRQTEEHLSVVRQLLGKLGGNKGGLSVIAGFLAGMVAARQADPPVLRKQGPDSVEGGVEYVDGFLRAIDRSAARNRYSYDLLEALAGGDQEVDISCGSVN